MLQTYYLSIGSNVHPEINVPECIKTLKRKYKVASISSIYETPPYGPCGTENFWNLALKIEAVLTRTVLQNELAEIESLHGRKRSGDNKFAPRTIDLDLLPRPGYQKLAFVMIPLAQIAPQEKDSETGKTFSELAKGLEQETAGFKKITLESNATLF